MKLKKSGFVPEVIFIFCVNAYSEESYTAIEFS